MKQFLVGLIFVVSIVSNALAQKSLEDYSFVVVPERFDFLTEDDQYQLNSMTKFFLEKKGYNAFFFDELPNVKNCDGLWADVDMKSNLTRTKMTIVLKDCKGVEVYRGIEGTSKYKDYRKTYQQSLRNTLKSMPVLPRNQAELIVVEKPKTTVSQNNTEVDKVIPAPKVEAIDQLNVVTSITQYPPQNTFNSYVYDGNSYLLKRIENGYNVYSVSDTSDAELALKGAIIKNNSGYTAIVFDTQYQCIFQENNDVMLVDATGKNKPITLTFQN